jgi:hypothetical protein
MQSILIALIVSLGFSSLLTPSANAKTPNVLWGYFLPSSRATGISKASLSAAMLPVVWK